MSTLATRNFAGKYKSSPYDTKSAPTRAKASGRARKARDRKAASTSSISRSSFSEASAGLATRTRPSVNRQSRNAASVSCIRLPYSPVPLRPQAGPLCRERPGNYVAAVAGWIGVGTAHWFGPPLPPNRTGGFPASGSPVDGFTSERIDRPGHGRYSGSTALGRRRRHSANAENPGREPGRVACSVSAASPAGVDASSGPAEEISAGHCAGSTRTSRAASGSRLL